MLDAQWKFAPPDVAKDEFSFRCTACSKPPTPKFYKPDACAPVVPGPKAMALIERLDRKKGAAWELRGAALGGILSV